MFNMPVCKESIKITNCYSLTSRFFYNHLWCPWDVDDTEGGDWPTKYLEPRLNLLVFFLYSDSDFFANLSIDTLFCIGFMK